MWVKTRKHVRRLGRSKRQNIVAGSREEKRYAEEDEM
jgi:hypothetical protein